MLSPDIQTIKGVIEQRFNMRGLPLTVPLRDLAFDQLKIQELRRLINKVFGKDLELAYYDDIAAIHRMLNAEKINELK